ncbi:MAG: hypothetical protein IPJ81_01020 [Chitinophagaceae bacterium]|nr:hypothetical protein [Chitinophagaceae bacterium]
MRNKILAKKALFIIVEVFILSISILLIFIFWNEYKDQQAKLKWPVATARITNWKIRHGDKFHQVIYEGVLDIQSGSYLFNLRRGNAEWKKGIGWAPKKDDPKEGDSLIIRYNPAYPTEAVRENVPSDKFIFLGLGIFLFVIALILSIIFLKPAAFRMNRHDRNKKIFKANDSTIK